MSYFCTIAFRANCVNPFSKFGFHSSYILYNDIRHFTCLKSLGYFQLQSRNSKSLQKYDIIRNHNMSYFTPWKTGFENALQFLNKKYLMFDTLSLKYAGFRCFSCVDDINYKEFFTLLNMPDTFYSWFKVTELHIWMLLFRLSQIKYDYREFRKGLVTGMWMDVERRAKAVDSFNRNYKKSLKELDKRFRTSLFIYDDGFLSNDMALTSALWLQFFEKDCKDPRKLEALVSFIRYQVNYLSNISRELLDSEEKIKIWTPFTPHFEKVNELV